MRAAIQSVEQLLGGRARRRSALVPAQLTSGEASLATVQQDLAGLGEQSDARQWEWDMLLQGVRPTAGQARQPTRLEQQLARLSGPAAPLAQRSERLPEQLAALQTWLRVLTADKAALTGASEVLIGLDAGFASEAREAYLIELGETVLTMVLSFHTTTRLQRASAADAPWRRVGANAETLALGPQRLGDGR